MDHDFKTQHIKDIEHRNEDGGKYTQVHKKKKK